ncbi:MAG: site-specific DNA-methyltransferase [Gammaproteobacteria bacterium]|nr:site-specific DNA-methyltransferase [Gammaproteobacteria bacterium]
MADVNILHGDCREQLKTLPDNSVDSIVTDPPYELGFMGKSWDASGIAYNVDMWRECLRVLKPGGHMLAFSGSRTYHRMTVAIEDAGFEIRDQIMWVYGTGFPKNHDISKAIDNAAGAERTGGGRVWSGGARSGGIIKDDASENTTERIIYDEPATLEAKKWQGWGTALKPSHEPICVARKPISEKTIADNVLQWGVGALNIDATRIPLDDNDPLQNGVKHDNKKLDTGDADTKWGFKAVDRAAGLGRWPANLIHDNSDEVTELFPNSKAGKDTGKRGTGGIWNSGNGVPVGFQYGDEGSAARFFYGAKASPQDRNDGLDNFEGGKTNDGRKKDANNAYQRGATIRKNTHPTVKPTDLMIYLCKMVTPPGGTVLDPFMGSGSTGRGAVNGGFNFIGIEMNSEYIDIAKARIAVVEKKMSEVKDKVTTYNNLFEEE